MARNPDRTFSFTYIDRSGEKSTHSIHTLIATEPGSALITAYMAALGNLSEMTMLSFNLNQVSRLSALAYAAGQREDKFLVVYQDDVTLAQYVAEIPGRLPALEPVAGTDEFDIAVAPFAAYVTAFNALVQSPDGNPASVLAIRLVGRSI